MEIDPSKKVIFVRPEPWTAQYYHGKANFMDELLLDLKNIHQVVLLPRGEDQRRYYQNHRFRPIFVPNGSISLAAVMENCDLFIGAGGTMTRETAVLGIPTVSIYQDHLLGVDHFLIDHGYMIHETILTSKKVLQLLSDTYRRDSDQVLLEKGKRAYDLIKSTLLTTCGKGDIR